MESKFRQYFEKWGVDTCVFTFFSFTLFFISVLWSFIFHLVLDFHLPVMEMLIIIVILTYALSFTKIAKKYLSLLLTVVTYLALTLYILLSGCFETLVIFYAFIPYMTSLFGSSNAILFAYLVSFIPGFYFVMFPLTNFQVIDLSGKPLINILYLILFSFLTALFTFVSVLLRRYSSFKYSRAYSQKVDESNLTQQSLLLTGITSTIYKSIDIINKHKSDLKKTYHNDQKALSLISKLEIGTDRIADIVNSLSIISKGVEKDSIEDFQSYSLMQKVREESSFFIENHQLTINKLTDNILLRGNLTLVSQILMNLIKNAAQEQQDDKMAWIKLEHKIDNQGVYFYVIDSGLGIDDDVAKQMFTPFFTTREKLQSSGLGLALSLKLIRSMGGDLRYLDSQKHTTFELMVKRSQQ